IRPFGKRTGALPGRANSVGRRARAGRISGWDWRREYTQTRNRLSDGFLDAFGARALRVVRARLEEPEPAAPLHQRLAADGARLFEQPRLRSLAVRRQGPAELALRIPRAAHEGAVSAGLPDEMSLVAERANLIRVCRRGLLGGAEHALQRTVEVLHDRNP